MNLFIAIVALTAFVAVYAVFLRPWLRTKEWAAGFFAWIEPIELHLYKKSETILWGRFQYFLALLLTGLGALGEIDYSFLEPFVDEKFHGALRMLPTFLLLTGRVTNALREDTTKPLELIAQPEDKPVEVAVAIAQADAANAVAVEAVAEAKATEGNTPPADPPPSPLGGV